MVWQNLRTTQGYVIFRKRLLKVSSLNKQLEKLITQTLYIQRTTSLKEKKLHKQYAIMKIVCYVHIIQSLQVMKLG